jgi:phospholipid/cholesterol/gamma-HCH transport system ATP-binding protein
VPAENASAAPPIEVVDLIAGYDDRVILEIPSLAIERGKITCIVGPSGCGKSTLLRNILLLEVPMSGRILVDGVDLAGDDGAALQRFRENSGVLFQSAALFNSLTLAQNVGFPIREHTNASTEIARAIALQKLALVGLADFADFIPAAVSGGMRKRAGIARALARDPDYLFLDEPSAGLDPINSSGLDELILRIRDAFGTTIVVVTHEIASLRNIADQVILLAEGRVLAAGPLAAVMATDHPLVHDFFGRNPPKPAREEGTFRGRLLASRRAT